MAFSFVYPHLLAGWRAAGAEIVPFSPLADEPPDPSCDVAWLPGGYPELHAGKLAAASRFADGMRAFAQTRPVHGECGGYMTLGAGLIDAAGTRHAMLGLLGLETDFAQRRLHLGYRTATLLAPIPGHGAGRVLRGHEFHYARVVAQPDQPLADIRDASGVPTAETGSRRGTSPGAFFTWSMRSRRTGHDGIRVHASPVGSIALIGGGPGDVDLLTLRAVERLRAADVILYDDLAGDEILSFARPDAELIAVGKRAGHPSPKQQEVSRLMIGYARLGKRVVRVKSGDPSIFARADEEISARRARPAFRSRSCPASPPRPLRRPISARR